MAAGAERTICALCSLPRLRVKAYIAALPPIIKRDVRRRTFEIYVTDALQIIVENTATPAAYCSNGKAGKTMTRRWVDLDKPAPPEETRTPEEIIEQLKVKADALREGGE